MRLFELYDRFEYLLKIFIPILAYVIGFFSHKYPEFRKAKNLNSILNLKKTSSELVLPVRSGHIETDVNKTSLTSNYVTYDEALILFELKNLLNELGGEKSKLRMLKDNEAVKPCNNTFYIGGILANNYVRRIFKEYFPTVKFACSKKSYDKHETSRSILVPIDSDDDKRWVQINCNNCLEYDSKNGGYIILIKMSGPIDFSDSDHGTVHICFGSDATATLAAIRCFNEHRSELYHRLKDRKDHYFVIVMCYKSGEINFNTFKDMTDEVFPK